MAARRRGGVGVGAVHQKKEVTVSVGIRNTSTLVQAKFQAKGSELAGEQIEHFSQQLTVFTTKLEEFAHRHRDEIRKNPQFRRHFQEMCASVGVDPLASSKGFWAEKLGVGDFYYELAVQIVEVCLATNHINGGILIVDELRERLIRSRSRTRKDAISNDDVMRAVEKLKVLGNGFELIALGNGRFLVQSVPGELSMDHSRVLQLADHGGFVTRESISDRLRWDETRVANALQHLTKQGIAWIDEQAPDDTVYYWFPSLFLQLRSSPAASELSDSVASLSACQSSVDVQ